VRIFLDTSVLLAACGSAAGASRLLFDRAENNGWVLLTVPYVLEETERNLAKMPESARDDWHRLRAKLLVEQDKLTFPHPVVYDNPKDRPVLASAFAHGELLLTLDRDDFVDLLGHHFYGLIIMEPGDFILQLRLQNRLR